MKALFLLLPLIYIGGNIYLFRHSLTAISPLPLWAKCIFSVIFWIAAFSLFLSIGLRDTMTPDWISRTMYRTGSVWMAFLLYMVLSLIVLDLIRLFIPAMGEPFPYALAFVTILLICGNINYHRPKTEHIDITLDKQYGKDNLKIVAVSDVHLGHGTGPGTLRKYVDMINAQSPDLVVITGDLIDNSVKPLLNRPFDKELARIAAPVYMVPGNHEYISGIDECCKYLSRADINILRDNVITLPEGIQIIGRDDRSNPERLPLEALMNRIDKEKPVVVLDHQPYDLAKTDSLKVDLQISGHTHAGQMWPLTHIVEGMYEQGHGYRKWDHSHIWVSSGLSLWGPPFRIGSRSDMAVINIRTTE